MSNIFENRVLSAITSIIHIFMLSITWLACCCTVVLAGPANTALYYALVKAIRHERSYALKEFWHSFKRNVKRGIIINLVLLVLGILIFSADYPAVILILAGKEEPQLVFVLSVLVKIFLYAGVSCWIYPLLSRFDAGEVRLVGVTFQIMLRYLPRSLLAVLLLIIGLVLCLGAPILSLILPGLIGYTMTFILEPVLKKLSKEQERYDEITDPWFLE